MSCPLLAPYRQKHSFRSNSYLHMLFIYIFRQLYGHDTTFYYELLQQSMYVFCFLFLVYITSSLTNWNHNSASLTHTYLSHMRRTKNSRIRYYV